jgi:formate hydrogenlyase transcriptional activator
MGKQIEHIPAETMSALISHEWPGNIRELQNSIERSVILSTGNKLRLLS